MSEETNWPRTLGKADFARQVLKRSPSYVTELLAAGRLVMEGSGRHARVVVAESIARIANTKGARDDVAARHAENAGSAMPEPQRGGENAPEGSTERAVTLRERRAEAELRKTLAQAAQEEMAAAKMRGDLIAREDVDAAMKFVGATLRSLLEVMPDQTAPLVAPVTSLDEVHAILQDQARNLAEQFGAAIARQKAELEKGVRA